MQMQTARARAPRGLLRRPPFWLVLVLVVGIFTALTGAVPITVYPLADLTGETAEVRA